MFKDIPITILKKRIKNINLRITRSGEVKLSAPNSCPDKEINRFLSEKESWIRNHLAKVKQRVKMQSLGEVSYYLGLPYPLQMLETLQKPKICMTENHIACYVRANSRDADIHLLLKNWQKEQMKKLVPGLIAKWEPIIKVKVDQWGVKAMVSRWGSCIPSKKRIWLSLYLIQKPLVCLEYVLVHEMVHLLEASHNARFHALMTQFLPDWKIYKQTLNGVAG